MTITKRKAKYYLDWVETLRQMYVDNVIRLEECMQEELQDKDLEFFWADGSVVGIGNKSRTMKLIHR
jgi:hypothetical protein